MDPNNSDPNNPAGSTTPPQSDLGSVLSPPSQAALSAQPPSDSSISTFSSPTPLPDLNSPGGSAPDLNQPTPPQPPDASSPYTSAQSWSSPPASAEASTPSPGLDLSSNPASSWAPPAPVAEPTPLAQSTPPIEPASNQAVSSSPLDNPYGVPATPPPLDAGSSLSGSTNESPLSAPSESSLTGQIFSPPSTDQASPAAGWPPNPHETPAAPSAGFTWPSSPTPNEPAAAAPTPAQPETPADIGASPLQPAEPAPTDLSHLINSSTSEPAAVYNPPLSQPETLVTAPGASAEVPDIPTEHSGGIPKWVLGVGAGLLIAVIGASAYFILGIGKSQEPTPSVPATGQETLTTPPPVVNKPTVAPLATNPPAATGSASFGQVQATPPSQATSAGELLRQRQLQGR